MKTLATLLNGTMALTCAGALATELSPDRAKAVPVLQAQTSPSADNTAINQRDKSGATKTPQDQSNQAQDRKLLASIRRAIVGDKSLSTTAHNAKVIVKGGAVTLRGPVKSAEEKAQVESLTRQVNGVTKIDNQLDV